ncbi:MAG: TonB-dependent receptor [Acidithiobacillus sp.]|nr:TonB-dependent receptor [Acidithiobacillus sp.]
MTLKTLRFAIYLAMIAASVRAGAKTAEPSNIDPTPLLVQVQVHNSAEIGQQTETFTHPASGADSSHLLDFVSGAQSVASGGVSALPYLNGLASDNLNLRVDGISIPNACPNQMIPPLSYLPPSQIGKIEVYPTVAPVSVSNNAMGGTILVSAEAPIFASPTQKYSYGGSVGAFYQSNGNIHGENLSIYGATPHFSIQYAGSLSQGDNYQAGKGFKPATSSIPAKTVGSSAFRSENQSVTLAGHWDTQELTLRISHQHIPYEGYPNVRMDLTDNQQASFNLHYRGGFHWGFVDARVYNVLIQHEMNFLPDKVTAMAAEMPMYSQGVKNGLRLEFGLDLSPQDLLRTGIEVARYHLNDWWTPVPGSRMMGPDTFWNIRDGRQNHYDAFADWSHHWNPEWMSRLGLRFAAVDMNSGPVQGYNPMMYGNPAMPGSVPGQFNAADRSRSFSNWDLSAILQYHPTAATALELGYARNVQAPSLYELYPWSSNQMAMFMNSFSGDGNGYIGNLHLRAQTSNTISASLHLQEVHWDLRVTPYVNYIQNYIGVERCPTNLGGACTIANRDAESGFVNLQYRNQNVLIWGVNLQGQTLLLHSQQWGDFFLDGKMAYTRGENLSLDVPLYRIMPLNGSLTLHQDWGHWENWIRETLVASKTRVDPLRNELQTPGYGLLELGTRYRSGPWQASLRLENLLNQLYYQPLGGVYLGQKPFVYGIPLPGPGRSVNLDLRYQF